MSDEIPFTTGPLRDWPFVEESFDRQMREQGKDDAFREEVLKGVQRFYAKINMSGSLTWLFPADTPAAVATDLDAQLREQGRLLTDFLNELAQNAVRECLIRELEIERLNRLVESLGGERPPRLIVGASDPGSDS